MMTSLPPRHGFLRCSAEEGNELAAFVLTRVDARSLSVARIRDVIERVSSSCDVIEYVFSKGDSTTDGQTRQSESG